MDASPDCLWRAWATLTKVMMRGLVPTAFRLFFLPRGSWKLIARRMAALLSRLVTSSS